MELNINVPLTPDRTALHSISDDEAVQLVDERFGSATEWSSPIISYRLSSDFQRHWKAEIGHWLATAQRHDYDDRLVEKVLSRARKGKHKLRATRDLDDPLYRFMLGELLPAMFAHFMLNTGWGYRLWDSPDGRGGDVDVGLLAPTNGEPVDVQIKAPGDENPFEALTNAARQLATSTNRTLVGVCSRGGIPLAYDPDELLASLLGTTTNMHGAVRRTRTGACATAEWNNIGGVAFLNYLPGWETQSYACTVVFNPWARPSARLEGDWFRGARRLELHAATFRWIPNAPSGSFYFPNGTGIGELAPNSPVSSNDGRAPS